MGGTSASGGTLNAHDPIISEEFILNIMGEGIQNSFPNEFANFLGFFPLAGRSYRSTGRRKKDNCNAPIPMIRGRHCNAYT